MLEPQRTCQHRRYTEKNTGKGCLKAYTKIKMKMDRTQQGEETASQRGCFNGDREPTNAAGSDLPPDGATT